MLLKKYVLILILLEYGLRLNSITVYASEEVCLNPYSIGIWSATLSLREQGIKWCNVLILILLEYGLRRLQREVKLVLKTCLNPYSIGIWSATINNHVSKQSHFQCLNPYSIGIWSATL